MPDRFSLSIPGRPQRWKRPEQVTLKGGRTIRYTDPAVRAYTEAVAWQAKKAWGTYPPWTGPVALSFVAIFDIPAGWSNQLRTEAMAGRIPHIADPDIDQICKLLLDAVKGIVFVDDNQVCAFVAPTLKRYGDPARTDLTFFRYAQLPGQITPGQRRLEAKQAQLALGLGDAPVGRRMKPYRTN